MGLGFSRDETPPEKLQEGVFKQLFEIAEIAKFTPEEQRAYENSLKYYRDLHNVIETSKLEAREEGIVMGREEGIAMGREEGIVIGKKEGIKSLVLKLSSRKLGEIPNSIQQKINQLSMKSLETLSEMLFDFNSLEDLEDCLGNNRE